MKLDLNDYDGIIFDLDGTLWDATAVNKQAWDKAYESLGYGKSPVSDEEFKSCMGMIIEDIARKIFPVVPDDKIDELIEECIKVEHEDLLRVGGILYPNLHKVMENLSQNHKLCIVSNCQAGYIEIFEKVSKVETYFTDIECPGNTGLKKADNIKLIVERNHFTNPIYIGDTKGDMDSAHAAGVPFVWASYGFGKDLSGYEDKINSLDELIEEG